MNLFSGKSSLNLDPKHIKPKTSCIFISHAHSDHLPSRRKKPESLPPIVCSNATAKLFQKRIGYKIDPKNSWENDDFAITTLPNGHTFDSTIAKIIEKKNDRKIIYTGDVNLEDRGYLKGYKPEKCDVLILEATWGDKNRIFPSFQNQMKKAREYITRQLNHGYPVALLGYSLGKAQLLNYLFGNLCENLFSCTSIWEMEQIHRELGLPLYQSQRLSEKNIESLKNEPWLLFFTHGRNRHPLLMKYRKKYNLKIVGFSGWAFNQKQYKYQTGADAGFVISDHSDYSKLITIVKQSEPSIVYTVFGDAIALAKQLQKDGFNAIPLQDKQVSLSNFC
ncbi:MAG: hypothetical protein U9O98_00670 [Asgard group archaeon]|nr:hypothetical protein [Asgard group archaeon]